MPHREPAARKHEPRITLWNSDRDSGPHQHPGARSKLRLLDRPEIVTSIPGMRPLRHRSIGNETSKGYVQREVQAHPQDGSTGGIKLQVRALLHVIIARAGTV